MTNRILLVTVTKVEATTTLDVFSKATGAKWKREIINDKMYYALGQVGGSDVFMVQSEMGSVGPGASLLTVSNAIHDLSPNAIIMVGTAFGVNPKKQKLGDILVSKQLAPYDPAKVADEYIAFRGDRVTCSTTLLDKFRAGDMDWQGSKVHFGLMLSGEKLVANQSFRDWLLSKEPEAIGGEMEGAGLYTAARANKVDWIVVKAICDWADERKNAKAQPLAAENAAQFVLYVLQHTFGHISDGNKQSSSTIEQDFDQKSIPSYSRLEKTDFVIHQLLDQLGGKGDFLVQELPSTINSEFFIELEGLINSLYRELDKALESGQSQFNSQILKALMGALDQEILPAAATWSEFVNQHRYDPRPREMFRNMKLIGREIRDLRRIAR